MKWLELKNQADLDLLIHQDQGHTADSFIIFKHSERCITSRVAKKMFEQEWSGEFPVYLVHVVESRPVSNAISEYYGVTHESPQVLAIKKGTCVYHASHSAIDANQAESEL